MRSATIIAVGLVAAAGIGGGVYVGATALHSPGQRTVPAVAQPATTAAHTTSTVATTSVTSTTTAAPTTTPAKPSADVQAAADERRACTILSNYDRSEAPVIAGLVAQGTNATIGGLGATAGAINQANTAANDGFVVFLSAHPEGSQVSPIVQLSGLFHELRGDFSPEISASTAQINRDYTHTASYCRAMFMLGFPTLPPAP